jgi:hypothetical protein
VDKRTEHSAAVTMVVALIFTTCGVGFLFGWMAYLLAGSVLAAAIVGVVAALAMTFTWLILLTTPRSR